MVADKQFPAIQPLRYGLHYLVWPIQQLVAQPELLGQGLAKEFASRQQLIEENQSLRRANVLLQAKLLTFNALQAENLRLRHLLRASKTLPIKVKVASLLAVDLEPYAQRIVINQGKIDGAHVGQAVIDARGLLGQIVRVGPYSSEVLLISDPSSAVPVIDLRSGLRLLAVGTGQANVLELKSAANTADIKEGDRMVTSGLGGRFPPDYPVCTVIAVIRTPGNPFAKIACKPDAFLDKHRTVLLLWNNTPLDHSSLTLPSTASGHS